MTRQNGKQKIKNKRKKLKKKKTMDDLERDLGSPKNA